MIISRQYNAEDGYTIQELLVVLLVGSLLLSLALSLLLFTGKLFHSWQATTELESTGSHILAMIARDFEESKRVVAVTDTSILLMKGTDSKVFYHFDGKNSYRNHIFLNSPDEIRVRVNFLAPADRKIRTDCSLLTHIGVKIDLKKAHYSAEVYCSTPSSGREKFLSTQDGCWKRE